MTISDTTLQDLKLIETRAVTDERGRFSRLFCETDFSSIRSDLKFVQINLSETTRNGAVRGMHFQQAPASEAKLIRCLRGCVFDVAVDLRANSSTFMQWHGVELSESNDLEIFIPEGFAHGFQALTDDVQLLYLHTHAWSQPCEMGMRHDDPKLAIKWPRWVTQISAKDKTYPLLTETFVGVTQ